MYEISSEVSFSAAHKLHNYNGPCEKIHGHNWRVRVVVRCETLNNQGIGIDFKALRQNLSEVIDTLDHSDLNELFDARGINPSSENIARYIYKELQREIGIEGCRVWCVDVYETPANCASYFEHA